MARYVRCKICKRINLASAYDCVCGNDLGNVANKIFLDDKEELLHDFQKEDIKECRCAACYAMNPEGIERCLACGADLKDAVPMKGAFENMAEPKEEEVPKVVQDRVLRPTASLSGGRISRPVTATVLQQEQEVVKKLVDIKNGKAYILEPGDKMFGAENEWADNLSEYGFVSRKHMLLRVYEDKAELYVLETRNGTYIREMGQLRRLNSGERLVLKKGDVLQLGGKNSDNRNVAVIRYEE